MFNFLKRGKTASKPDTGRDDKSGADGNSRQCAGRADKQDTRRSDTLRKDVVNLLIPSTDYGQQKTGVGAILQSIMAGRKRSRKKRHKHLARAESYKEISNSYEEPVTLVRSNSQNEKVREETLSAPVSETDLTYDAIFDGNNDAPAAQDDADAANFVKELVMQKYKNKSPQAKRQHVSLVYVSSEPERAREAEREHAASQLREIAKKINCELNEPMGAADSKGEDRSKRERRNDEPDESMSAIKDELRSELEKLLKTDQTERSEFQDANEIINEGMVTEIVVTPDDSENHYEEIIEQDSLVNQDENIDNKLEYEQCEETESISDCEENDEKLNCEDYADNDNLKVETEEVETVESPILVKKSNLKPPRSDTEGNSDDDRSDSGKKKVTFRKTIVFDDGDEQTDEEVDSSFESITSSEEEESEEETEEEDAPDNDELLGGVVVTRNEDITDKQSDNKQAEEVISSDSEKDARITSDNSDSGFLEISEIVEEGGVSETESEEVTDSDEYETEEEEVTAIVQEPDDDREYTKNLVNQEDSLTSQVQQLSEIADNRCGEVERARDLLASYRKEIEAKDHEIAQLKTELSAAYKEVELIRQRSRSLEDELVAARSCSADLAGKLTTVSDDAECSLRSELESARASLGELLARVSSLQQDKERLERERDQQEQKALEAVSAAEASSARWKAAHEAARSQAAARAERLLADCEWKMRELEKRARDAEKQNAELKEAAKQSDANNCSQAELQQLRGVVSEQQRSVVSLSTQLQRVEAREDALQVEVTRLKDLLDKEAELQKQKDEKHLQHISRLESAHTKRVETVRSELSAQHAATRATLERAHAERTRTALAQLRAEHEREERNHERKMREQQNRFDSIKESLETRQGELESSLAEARSEADWELLQLRHLLDKADIAHARAVEDMSQEHEREIERLNAEWAERLRLAEESAETAAGEASSLLEKTRSRLEAERADQVTRLKEQHKNEMDEQWENFMQDKETCLARMKLECRQEGEEEMSRRERDMLDEIIELKAQIALRSNDYNDLANKTAACERTLDVTEQELREALEREKELRSLRSEDAEKLKKAKNESKNEVEHLQRKCACVRKLFDDMRAKLAAREKTSAEESRSQQREIAQLKTEVARLTKMLIQQSVPSLGARTRADGCDFDAESFFCESAPQACESQPSAPRRKGGTLRTPELQRRRTEHLPLRPLNLTDLKRIDPDDGSGRRRAKSVDLPAVQVPVRINQFEDKNK